MDSRMTADEFVRQKPEFPEAGRWHELHEGRPVIMDPPDDDHGNAVLNLSRAFAVWLQHHQDKVSYACHEIGILVASEPDTVYCPAMSFFNSGSQFEESEREVAQKIPALVVEIASANDRRREMRLRTLAYMNSGVQTIWVADTMKKEVQIVSHNDQTLALAGRQSVQSKQLLPGFEISVADIFRQPGWWK